MSVKVARLWQDGGKTHSFSGKTLFSALARMSVKLARLWQDSGKTHCFSGKTLFGLFVSHNCVQIDWQEIAPSNPYIILRSLRKRTWACATGHVPPRTGSSRILPRPCFSRQALWLHSRILPQGSVSLRSWCIPTECQVRCLIFVFTTWTYSAWCPSSWGEERWKVGGHKNKGSLRDTLN